MSAPENLERFETLVAIIDRLRGPDGCPWDRKQSHASLRENLLSECYETLAALDSGDAAELCEELGDLLLQIVLHARIAAENGDFTIDDVIAGITAKLVHRHPHIFGDGTARDAEEVMVNWETLKEDEREAGESMLDGVPTAMPALGYSLEVQKRAARVGFDWDEIDDIVDKLAEEVREFQQGDSREEREEEFGDLLFTLVNIGRRLGVDAEAALRQANRKFYRRFTRMEEISHQRGARFGDLPFAEQNALWEKVKAMEKEDGRGERI